MASLELEDVPITDTFLLKLGECRNEIDTKFQQLSDHLVSRQNQIHSQLDQIEKNYSESQNAEISINEIKEAKKDQEITLERLYNILPEQAISSMKQTINSFKIQLYDLSEKVKSYETIEIELDTTDVDKLIESLGQVMLDEHTHHRPNNTYRMKSLTITNKANSSRTLANFEQFRLAQNKISSNTKNSPSDDNFINYAHQSNPMSPANSKPTLPSLSDITKTYPYVNKKFLSKLKFNDNEIFVIKLANLPNMEDHIGEHVICKTLNTVKLYVGVLRHIIRSRTSIKGSDTNQIALIEFSKNVGNSSGSYRGERYIECKPNFCTFCPVTDAFVRVINQRLDYRK